MSNPPIPPEILDHIIDHLRDEPNALQNCCLVAKSWVPCARKHLFADIQFSSPKHLESWKKTFPDPSNSPAYHTHTLSVKCLEVVMAADGEEGGWIRAFSRVVRLEVGNITPGFSREWKVSLAPFHAFSPILRSLHVVSTKLSLSRIFGLIHSLPLLEDLILVVNGIPNNDGLDASGPPVGTPPPSSPVFTGTLRLIIFRGIGPIVRRLLDLPNGLHFRQLILTWVWEDELQWINALVAECSDTLESITASRTRRASGLTRSSIDLSRATRLKDVQFDYGGLGVKWIAMALQTVTSRHGDLRKIVIHIYDSTFSNPGADIRQMVGEAAYGEWLDLDRLLIKFWELRLIRPKVAYSAASADREETINRVSCLLPETTNRGIVDLYVQ